MASQDTPPTGESETLDVLIIGAGPSGLAVAARLRESHPSALFTDEEQARYSWISRKSAATRNRRNQKIHRPFNHDPRMSNNQRQTKMMVLDSTGPTWMQRWNSLFERLDIKHLRSPMFFHIDPQDRESLLGFCHAHRERSALLRPQEICNCVGREISKHMKKKRARCSGSVVKESKCPVEINERDRKDYFAPSAAVFKQFCKEFAIQRYGLDHKGLVQHEQVADIRFRIIPSISTTEEYFEVLTSTSRRFIAKTIVVAVGGGELVYPLAFPRDVAHQAFTHALDLAKSTPILPPRLRDRMKRGELTRILVVGGGLTSAQAADQCIRAGVSEVHLVMRGPWKVKPFDIDLEWMGSKWRNQQKAAFWTEDDLQARLHIAKDARGGGSITPRFAKILKDHVKAGKLVVHTWTEVISWSYKPTEAEWTVQAQSTASISTMLTETGPVDLPTYNYVVLATGTNTPVTDIPFLKTLQSSHPIESIDGFPALTNDLAWRSDVPLFVTGKLATLQLGPGAGNLEGARMGAERIAWAITDGLGGVRDSDEVEDDEDMVDRYISGVGSKFEGLSCESIPAAA